MTWPRMRLCLVWALCGFFTVLCWSAVAFVLLLSTGCAPDPVETVRSQATTLHDQAAAATVEAAEAIALADAEPAGADSAALRAAAARLAARAQALDQLASGADSRASKATAAAELASWRTLCRWIALGCVVAAVAVAGLGMWSGAWVLARMPAALIAAMGFAVQAWGESLGSLALILPLSLAAVAIAAAVWLIVRHHRTDAVANRDRADEHLGTISQLELAGTTAARELTRYAETIGAQNPELRIALDAESKGRQGSAVVPILDRWLGH